MNIIKTSSDCWRAISFSIPTDKEQKEIDNFHTYIHELTLKATKRLVEKYNN